MAVREKTLTRTYVAVKHSATPCGLRAQSHKAANSLALAWQVLLRPFLLQVLVIPPQNPIQPVHQMLLLMKPMRLSRINHKLRLHSISLQTAIQFLALPQRINRIRIALQHQRWRLRILQMHERRAIQKSLWLLPRNAVKPFVPRGMILCAKFRNQVRHPRARNRRLEHVCLRDRPLRHVPAVRPSSNSQLLRVRDAALHKILHARHHILEIAAAPIPAIRFHKSFKCVTCFGAPFWSHNHTSCGRVAPCEKNAISPLPVTAMPPAGAGAGARSCRAPSPAYVTSKFEKLFAATSTTEPSFCQ